MPTAPLGRYKYELDDELGSGGMATVFLAQDPLVNRQVAVKVLAYGLTNDKEVEEYFKREAEIIAHLEHACIVPVYDVGQLGKQPFIVMRYMQGGTFLRRLRKGKLASGELARVVYRVGQALAAAHSIGVVHRDVKPSNILYDNEGDAFLADFGLAKLLRLDANTGNLFAGTPAYMSPEQVRDEELDGRSDVYALGVLIYRALTGTVPYDYRDSIKTAKAHLLEPVPNILQARPDLNPAWQDVIARSMAKEPSDRYETAPELAAVVSEIDSGRWFMRKLVDF